jgi:hypothetical protein
MPNPSPKTLLFEPFIETDEVLVVSTSKDTGGNPTRGQISCEGKNRWLEITVGVIGLKGTMHALNPSITVKETGGILTLEEKFQGTLSISLSKYTMELFIESPKLSSRADF